MLIFSLAIIAALFYTLPSYANPACAVCTVGVAVGLEVARNLGVDDSVIAVWAGALLMLIGYWTILWCDKKGWNFAFRNPLLIVYKRFGLYTKTDFSFLFGSVFVLYFVRRGCIDI